MLVTGATGFLGPRVVASLRAEGFTHIRCLARPSSDTSRLESLRKLPGSPLEIVRGNLLSREDCAGMTRDVATVIHLAAARGEKSFPDAFMNSVVTTRNLIEASLAAGTLRRFVNVSSFTVYTTPSAGAVVDETCPIEPRPERRGDAYCFAKVKQDEIVLDYGRRCALPYVIVRPGYVYGPGNEAITGRVGIRPFGVFLHLGGSNTVPFVYVDNCADAIVLAAIAGGVDGEVFNVVDDDLPSSRQFLHLYKRHVREFRSIPIPRPVSRAFCGLWEAYSEWSQGQLPPAFNSRTWRAYWAHRRYSNAYIKSRLGWTPSVSTRDGLERYFASCRRLNAHA